MEKRSVTILHQNLVDLNGLADDMIKEYNHKNNIVKDGLVRKEQIKRQINIMRGGDTGCGLCGMKGGCDCSMKGGRDTGCGYCSMKGGSSGSRGGKDTGCGLKDTGCGYCGRKF